MFYFSWYKKSKESKNSEKSERLGEEDWKKSKKNMEKYRKRKDVIGLISSVFDAHMKKHDDRKAEKVKLWSTKAVSEVFYLV